MTNLNSRSALHPRWTKAPLTVLRAFETVIIAIFDPNSESSGWDYDPYARFGTELEAFGEGDFGEGSFGGGTSGHPGGTSVPTRLWQGPAQFQVYRQALTVDDVAGSVSQLRSVRITADPNGPNFPVRKGLIVRVISSPLNPSLESYEVTVTSGMTSALAWKRTIEGEVDQSVIAPRSQNSGSLMVQFSTRYTTKRITDGIHGAIKVLESSRQEFEEAAEEVAEWWGSGIRASGRGGGHNAQMANIQTQVTTPRAGGYFIRVGWLSGAPQAANGATTWFVYHDTGYRLFGGSHIVPGLMLQIDARQRLEVAIFKASERIARRAEREIGRA